MTDPKENIEMLKMFDAIIEGVFSERKDFSKRELEECIESLYENQKKLLLYLLMKSVNDEKLNDIDIETEKEFINVSTSKFLTTIIELIGWVDLTNRAAYWQSKE